MEEKLFLLMVLMMCIRSDGKIAKGDIDTQKDWMFLQKFCFRSSIGRIKMNLTYKKEFIGTEILLYYDTQDQWPSVFGTNKTCKQKRNISQSLELVCNCSERCSCYGETPFRSARDRWWYIVIANCGSHNSSTKGIRAKYDVKLSNGKPNDIFQYHFSCDEFAIFPTSIAFLILFIILMGFAVFIAIQLRSRHLLHSTFKLCLTAMIFKLLHLIFATRANADFAKTGQQSLLNPVIGEFCSTCANAFFVLLLIFISKGFTITRASISPTGTIKILVFFFIYFLLSIILFVAGEMAYDPAKDDSRFDSVVGWLVVGLHLLGFVWFTYACVITLKKYPEKVNFYGPFYVLFTVWFMALPVIIVLANLVIDSWATAKIFYGVELATSFVGFTFFLVLTRPSAANRNFPFHIRTTQIDAFLDNAIDGGSGVGNGSGGGGGGGGVSGNDGLDPTSFPRASASMNALNGQAAMYAVSMFTATSKSVSTRKEGNMSENPSPREEPEDSSRDTLKIFSIARTMRD